MQGLGWGEDTGTALDSTSVEQGGNSRHWDAGRHWDASRHWGTGRGRLMLRQTGSLARNPKDSSLGLVSLGLPG